MALGTQRSRLAWDGRARLFGLLLRAAIGAEPFYRRHGFEAVGPGATSKRGVDIPHTRMERAA